MRMLAPLTPLLLLGAAPPSDTPAPSVPIQTRVVSPIPPHCRAPHLAVTDRRLAPRKLGELPPADAYHAVFRTDQHGCPDPLLVSERIGWTRQKPGK